MHLVYLLHQGDQLQRAKLDQFIDGRRNVLVLSTDVLLFGHAAFLENTVERLAFVHRFARAVKHTEKNQRVGQNLSFSILEDFRVDQSGCTRFVILEL